MSSRHRGYKWQLPSKLMARSPLLYQPTRTLPVDHARSRLTQPSRARKKAVRFLQFPTVQATDEIYSSTIGRTTTNASKRQQLQAGQPTELIAKEATASHITNAADRVFSSSGTLSGVSCVANIALTTTHPFCRLPSLNSCRL